VTGLQRKLARARRGLDAETTPAQFSGHIIAISDVAAMVELQGLPAPVAVPAVTVRAAGIGSIGSAVIASWEILAGGRTMLSVEPAIEMPCRSQRASPTWSERRRPQDPWPATRRQGRAQELGCSSDRSSVPGACANSSKN